MCIYLNVFCKLADILLHSTCLLLNMNNKSILTLIRQTSYRCKELMRAILLLNVVLWLKLKGEEILCIFIISLAIFDDLVVLRLLIKFYVLFTLM